MAQKVQTAYSVLVVSGTDRGASFLCDLLPVRRFTPVARAQNAGEARRLLLDQPFDLLLVNAPLPDEFGTQLACDMGAQYGCGVLLLTRAELYEQISYQLEGSGVFCLAKPCTAQLALQAVQVLASGQDRLRQLQQKAQSLQYKMEEIRLVNRAKWVLIERFQMDEAQAHRTIEKQAMDTRTTRREVAENIIQLYEN